MENIIELKVYLHAFTDGEMLILNLEKHLCNQIEKKLAKNTVNCFIIGRYYAMDRDQRWERVKLAYDLLVTNGKEASSPTFEESFKKAMI